MSPPPHRGVSAQQLLDLVADTLDPGYAAAAARRAGHSPAGVTRHRHWYDRPLVAVGALLVGFVLVVAYVHTNRGAPEAQRVRDRLGERVRSAQERADALSADLRRTGADLDRQQAAALPASGALARGLSRARLAAGQVAVRGPGLVVTLAEPEVESTPSPGQRGGTVPVVTTHILTDRDVRAVVNQLWSDRAEAIAVNGIRLTPTSAIRFAGEAILVDLQPLRSPYRIEAVGDADRLATDFAQSAVAGKYQTLKDASGIGFSFANKTELRLPASTSVTPRYAKPAPKPAPTSSSTRTSR